MSCISDQLPELQIINVFVTQIQNCFHLFIGTHEMHKRMMLLCSILILETREFELNLYFLCFKCMLHTP